MDINVDQVASFLYGSPQLPFGYPEPLHPDAELVLTDEQRARAVFIDEFFQDVPNLIAAWQASQRHWWDFDAPDPGLLLGGLVETIFIDKYDAQWQAVLPLLWQLQNDWRSYEHVNAFIADEAHVADIFLSWWVPGSQPSGPTGP